MWKQLAKLVIKNKFFCVGFLFITTLIMGYFATQVKLSYEFAKAVPTNNVKYIEYLSFRKKFGDDGNILVIGVSSTQLFTLPIFKQYQQLANSLKSIKEVEDVFCIPTAFNLTKDSTGEKLSSVKIFATEVASQAQLDSASAVFFSLPFYNNRLYNSTTHSYLMAVRINKEILASKERSRVINAVNAEITQFERSTKITTYVSGLPLIRTMIADRVKNEMGIFLFASIALSVLILWLFFKSISTTLLSILVVLIGVVYTIATIYLLGYQISILTALIPSLVVVIGIPNCIYFINKYHSIFLKDNLNLSPSDRKINALVGMVSKMGVVTLFCNISAAIGFVVFAFTKSEILKEFGVVAATSIMLVFVISFMLLPAALSLLPAPTTRQLKYIDNKFILSAIDTIQHWVTFYQKQVIGIAAVVLILAIAGMARLQTLAFIVDDLPKQDKIYTDLKYFEKNFKGVMPLEILIDTKKKRGLSGVKALSIFEKVDSLAQFIASQKEMNYPLSLAEGLKFAKQGFYEGDSTNYLLPNSFDAAFVGQYLRPNKDTTASQSNFTKIVRSFMDSTLQTTRISVSMADVGTQALPIVLSKIQQRSAELFDSTYSVTLTGSSITFLEGSKFIINGLKESIVWAFVLIAFCMLILFKSFRILLCSLIPNLIPLVVTAGIMGWAGVPLKPTTVLVFSVALGIAIDITIRFLVNYKQVLPEYNNDVAAAVKATIQQTGLSIIYTSLVLTAGFIIFCASSFGGIFALGWLTSITLLIATLTNLVLLPILLLVFAKRK